MEAGAARRSVLVDRDQRVGPVEFKLNKIIEVVSGIKAGEDFAQVEPVLPPGEVRDAIDLAIDIRECEDVLAQVAGQRIGPGPAVEDVRTAAATQIVIAVAAAERVVAAAAQHEVHTAFAEQGVLATSATQIVASAAAVERVVAGSASKPVVADAAEKPVAPATAIEDIAPCIASQDIVAGAAGQAIIAAKATRIVVLGGSREHVGAGRAGERYQGRHCPYRVAFLVEIDARRGPHDGCPRKDFISVTQQSRYPG